jgi:hypothetical protein
MNVPYSRVKLATHTHTYWYCICLLLISLCKTELQVEILKEEACGTCANLRSEICKKNFS